MNRARPMAARLITPSSALFERKNSVLSFEESPMSDILRESSNICDMGAVHLVRLKPSKRLWPHIGDTKAF